MGEISASAYLPVWRITQLASPRHLLDDPTPRATPIEDLTTWKTERWRTGLVAEGRLSNRSVDKLLTILHGILERARRTYRLPLNPVAGVDRQPRKKRVSIDVFSAEEVLALTRAAGQPAPSRTKPSCSLQPSQRCVGCRPSRVRGGRRTTVGVGSDRRTDRLIDGDGAGLSPPVAVCSRG
jgi:hypothetical protein